MGDRVEEPFFEDEEYENVYDNFNAEIHVNKGTSNNHENDALVENPTSSGTESSTSSQCLNEDKKDDEKSDASGSSDKEEEQMSNNSTLEEEKKKKKKKKKKKSELEKGKKENDIKLAVKIALQVLLKSQPFPVKREDLFSVINIFVPNCNNNVKKKKKILKLLQKKVKNILALNLLTLNSKTKTEYVLTQCITYRKHNDFLLSSMDHDIRGFLIFLIPFFNVFHNKIPLNYLLYELNNVGHKLLKTKEEVVKILSSPNVLSTIANHILMTKQLSDPLDYLIYSKKLSYIDFSSDHQYDESSLDGFYCIPTARFESEVNMKQYITDLLSVPNKNFQLKDVYVLFDEKYFLDINYDNL
ncbi:conserved Plasmodium protein, unknown function [Plasmodium knowlesi strain H]|uniref:Uncharacterized protein n=3 Tax=Plasmodium knowlesi TaxID=5850 RepID=A0A5K1UF63_PLAKH|nr:conserved protein, unknown function [Plasmodium knowlesi strain H]OTN65573.1 Uncharacterized protein PKNOH_S110103100 [Plasmodium knowlesi]CAA9989650.1 conserved protein, unknown function [Plasmodium knowlesi strain H]SBO22759.1 conserved Plasmodium protein, unknown function [Plasmodium knowlesi strain H]SBO23141.1 conserved Plasmodium protein, unknown function [Plasmodium knowlesi strain H]VVS79124.1 conserved protein, unknown function [Plasmodium knowlesi strain H]|eukprot:XP_002260374.1 hypothetical protein, conserved in Plasmodium species [Plasmodium knowlesi strain H]